MFFIKETMAVLIARSLPHEINIADLKFNGFFYLFNVGFVGFRAV